MMESRYYVMPRIEHGAVVYDICDYLDASGPCFGLSAIVSQSTADKHARTLNEGYLVCRAFLIAYAKKSAA